MSAFLPSGTQWTITHGQQSATVVSVGGGLREYTVDGRPVLYGYPEDAKADAGRGQLLMPWPNRVADGKYTFRGKQQQLPLTEPAKSNASHGLVRWAPWEVVDRGDAWIEVTNTVMPQPGWDYPLRLSVRYELGEAGLSVTPNATSIGDGPAPFGFGAHPYLTVGEEQVDDLTLSIPAATVLQTDERSIPTASVSVTPDLDFREPRTVGWAQIDHAYTDLSDDSGRWAVSISTEAHRSTLWADADAFGYVQVFTGDSLPAERRRRTGIAVEPMTCPANALATGEALMVLEPGQSWSASWGVSAS
ncbi:aldose 1-epimerase family protein [Dermacoccaceae bacterium W4C1]